jgi:NAD(P)-dependent dehydrogenase (short-subunit alcohol dehydrogenase family)
VQRMQLLQGTKHQVMKRHLKLFVSINYLSALLLTHHFVQKMKDSHFGRIINISSGSEEHGGILPSFGFASAKNAVNFMTQILPKRTRII